MSLYEDFLEHINANLTDGEFINCTLELRNSDAEQFMSAFKEKQITKSNQKAYNIHICQFPDGIFLAFDKRHLKGIINHSNLLDLLSSDELTSLLKRKAGIKKSKGFG